MHDVGNRVTPGSMLLHYRLLEQLGSGGMGVVWKAIDTALEREVAIKLLPEAFAADPERLARFAREAKMLASLNHPNVAAIYGLHEDGGIRFLAMELVRGSSLKDEISRHITPERVVDLAVGIADGLAAAHRQHVVHRDLKPDNIMIDAEGRPKILDFGLAKLMAGDALSDTATAVRDSVETRRGAIVGTVAYMSPEQAEGKTIDIRSDIFSLGIVLYEMTTGRRPFGGENSVSTLTSILRDTPVPVSRIVPDAPPPLDSAIRHCLEKEPSKRYQSAALLRDDLRTLRGDVISHPGGMPAVRQRRRLRWAAAAVVLMIALAAGAWSWQRLAKQRWVRDVALPQLESLVERIQALEEGRESWDAYILARAIDEAWPGQPDVARLRERFTRKFTITSQPPGARVYARYYDEPDAEPLLIGITPLVDAVYPRGFTRLHLEIDGKVPIDDVVFNHPLGGGSVNYRLHAAGELPEEMSWIPEGTFDVFLPGFDHLQAEPVAAFLMDRHEVTNADYKRFVDAGGYGEARYWVHPFVDGGGELSREEALARFVDRTGRPGPATWEIGSYPEGEAAYPVTGVSWYEAAAYAAWAGKELPTVFHWNRVAFTVGASRIVPASNLRGKGPRPVGDARGMNRFGVADLAGNAREWTWNATDGGAARFILGGGWNDPDYAFMDGYAQAPMDRSPTNGFLCIRIVGSEPNLAALRRPLDRPARDFMAEKPVPDAIFAEYLRQFAYDKVPLDAKIEEEKTLPWAIRQKITFRAAYGGERMIAFLFLPLKGRPPYQTVVVFPGSGALNLRSSGALDTNRQQFFVKSGRAVIHPIYKATYERGTELKSDYPAETALYKDHVIMWAKDLARSIDYLETRADIDAGRIGYFGISWGGAMGSIMPAVETRIKANVLYVAGLNFQRALPEVDQINYVTHVKQPTLILNGEHDFYFPPETSQKPMFELLGTPAEHKKRLVYPGGHSVPREVMIRESLAWFDRYLGPVQ